MIKVTPMDDELAIGHEGRIAWVNVVPNQREFDRLMTASSSQEGIAKLNRPSRLSQLAAHAEMSPTDYARKHSMLAAFRVAGRHGETFAHGAAEGESFNRRLGMLTQKAGTYICLGCVGEDLEKRQRSWYRRQHHLYGVDWCPVHHQALWRITAQNPWAGSPHHWVESGEIEQTFELGPDQVSKSTEFLNRYAGIALSFLDRDHPLDIRALGHLISRRAQELGLRISLTGKKLTISDHIESRAPTLWLESYFKDIAFKEKSTVVSRIDDAAKSRAVPAQGSIYGVVLAAFFDSTQEAISYLNNDVKPEVANNIKTPRHRGSKFWHGELWDLYVKCDGQTQRMAQSLGIDRTYLQEKMWSLGMPSLYNAPFSSSWHALVRFHDGESLIRSCELEAVEVSEVEALQRKTSPQSVALASKILKKFQKEKAISSKRAPLRCSDFDEPVKSVLPAPNQEFNRFLDTFVADQDATWQPSEKMKAA